MLAGYKDAVAMRLPEHVRTMAGGRPSTDQTRVTIGVVSSDVNNPHARLCIDLLKKHTSNFDLIVLDNNCGPGFNHASEMNRLLDICRTDYLVLMDDDVWVKPGWLKGLLACLAPDVALVVPQQYGRDEKFSFAGIVMCPDSSGRHSHIYAPIARSAPTQTICSAVMLIDMGKIGHLRLDESYTKYFLDIDYGLRVWEAGYKVMVAADCSCTHLGGATLAYGSNLSDQLNNSQRQQWVRNWIPTGRYERLVRSAWSSVPELQPILGFPERLKELLIRQPDESLDAFIERAMPVMSLIQAIPAMLGYAEEAVVDASAGRFAGVYDEKIGHLMLLHAMCGTPHQINGNREGFDIYMSGTRFYSVAANHALPLRSQLLLEDLPGFSAADSLSDLHTRISNGLVSRSDGRGGKQLAAAVEVERRPLVPNLVREGFLGYNIIRFDRFYGVLQSEGAFHSLHAQANSFPGLITRDTMIAVKSAIVMAWLRRAPRRVVGRLLRALGRNANQPENWRKFDI